MTKNENNMTKNENNTKEEFVYGSTLRAPNTNLKIAVYTGMVVLGLPIAAFIFDLAALMLK